MEFKKVSYNQIYNIRQRVGFRCADGKREEERRKVRFEGFLGRIGRGWVELGLGDLN